MNVKERLFALQDETYQQFSQKLIPNEAHIIGVRIPEQRKLAKEIMKEDPIFFLEHVENDYMEQTMIEGFVIGMVDVSKEERKRYIDRFVPKITNWSVCDGFCSALKEAKKEQAFYWDIVCAYSKQSEPYAQRFAAVMLLCHFVNDTYIDESLKLLESLTHEDYYVKMGIAWAVSKFFTNMPDQMWPFLEDNQLDDWTHNKAISKCTDSLRVDAKTKVRLKKLRRT